MQINEKVKCRVPFGTMSVPKDVIQSINTMLANKMLTNGKYVETFETEFAKRFERQHAVAVSSGTDALILALAALQDFGMHRSDKVLVPALTFVATANAVIHAGYQPKFVDVDKETLNMNIHALEDAIDTETRAIVVVHLMGNPVQMDKIKEIADKYDLFLIEDCAEAHGAMYQNKPVGSWGLMSCYSLYAAHIVSSVEGGMITTNSSECKEVLKSLRNHGLQLNGSDWSFKRIGYSSKMNELEAAIGLFNLNNFDEILYTRKKNFIYLQNAFQQWSHYFSTMTVNSKATIGPHAFPIIVTNEAPFEKEEFVKYLSSKGIDNRNLFYSIPTQCEPYKKYIAGIYPNAEFCSKNGTHIGVHQDLTLEQLDYVIDSVKEFIEFYE